MRYVRIVNRTRDSVLGSHVGLADEMWSRARGLLGRPRPTHGEGLLLNPCRAVHTLGMNYPIDVIFVDRHGHVLALYPDLRPRRITGWHARATYALEVPTGTIAASGTTLGDQLAWLPADPQDVELRDTESRHAEPPNGSAGGVQRSAGVNAS